MYQNKPYKPTDYDGWCSNFDNFAIDQTHSKLKQPFNEKLFEVSFAPRVVNGMANSFDEFFCTVDKNDDRYNEVVLG